MNKNCLSYWFPLIRDAGLPVPRTVIHTMPNAVRDDVFQILDGKPMRATGAAWMDGFRAIARAFGLPCFMRTGQTSNKHYWRESCCLKDIANLEKQVVNLIEFSECCDFMGLPWNVWVLREMLPVRPLFHAFRGFMPIVREFRAFSRDGETICVHPYWPEGAVEEGNPQVGDWRDRLAFANRLSSREESDIQELAAMASKVCGGAWSVDVLATDRGWSITDMAEAHRSFHWHGCPMAESFGL